MVRRYIARLGLVVLGLALCTPLVAQYQPLEMLNPPAAPTTAANPPGAAPAPGTTAAPTQPAAAPVQFVGLDSVQQELGQSWSEIWQVFLRVWNLVLFEVGEGRPPIRV